MKKFNYHKFINKKDETMKKILKKSTVVFLTVAFMLGLSLGAFAMNTGFKTSEFQDEEKKTILSNFKLTLVTEEAPGNPITCFDVNDSGLIAIGAEDSLDSTKKSVWVYDSAGTFRHGYTFDNDGTFGIEWDGNNIIIYLVRSDIAALVDEKGNVLDVQKIENTTDNNSYWNHSVFSTQRTVGNYKYTIKNDMGLFNILAPSYSQLIAVDDLGNQTIIYDFSTEYNTRFVVNSTAIIAFVAIVVGVLVVRVKKFNAGGKYGKDTGRT